MVAPGISIPVCQPNSGFISTNSRGHRLGDVGAVVVLLYRDGQREVGRPEPDPDEVQHRFVPVGSLGVDCENVVYGHHAPAIWLTAPGTGWEGSDPSATIRLAVSTCTTLVRCDGEFGFVQLQERHDDDEISWRDQMCRSTVDADHARASRRR